MNGAGDVARRKALGIAHIHDQHLPGGVQRLKLRELDQHIFNYRRPRLELGQRSQRDHSYTNQRQDHPQRRANPSQDSSHCPFPHRISG